MAAGTPPGEEIMKDLVFINGTMGVGKSATCRKLLSLLSPAAFLDGDWCWSMSPFVVNEETKAMVLDNAAYVLNSFLHCSAYRYVIFCWVMHEFSIVEEMLRRLDMSDACFSLFTLTASEEALSARLRKDMEEGKRSPDVLGRSLERLPLYAAMNGRRIDVSSMTPAEAAGMIAAILADRDAGVASGVC